MPFHHNQLRGCRTRLWLAAGTDYFYPGKPTRASDRKFQWHRFHSYQMEISDAEAWLPLSVPATRVQDPVQQNRNGENEFSFPLKGKMLMPAVYRYQPPARQLLSKMNPDRIQENISQQTMRVAI